MHRVRTRRHLLPLGAIAAAVSAIALPAYAVGSSQPGTVFRCEVEGRVLYTDSPCPRAERVDTIRVPGPRLHSPRLHSPQAVTASWEAAESPLRVTDARSYGWDPRTHRFAQPEKAECPHLAQRMALVEAEERTATAASIGLIQERLSVQRQRFRELGC